MKDPAQGEPHSAGATEEQPNLDRETIEDLEPIPDDALGVRAGKPRSLQCGTAAGTACAGEGHGTNAT